MGQVLRLRSLQQVKQPAARSAGSLMDKERARMINRSKSSSETMLGIMESEPRSLEQSTWMAWS